MICWMVCLPSQRSTISRLGPLRRRARSGMSRTRCWLFSPRRQPGARRGRLFSSGGMVSSSRILCGPECARGRPARIDVGKVEGVELSPEDVALGAQGGVRGVLFQARVRVLDNPGKGKIGVLGSLRQAASEIIEAAGKPGIVFAKPVHAKCDELL